MSHFVAKSSPVGRNWFVNNAHICRKRSPKRMFCELLRQYYDIITTVLQSHTTRLRTTYDKHYLANFFDSQKNS